MTELKSSTLTLSSCAEIPVLYYYKEKLACSVSISYDLPVCEHASVPAFFFFYSCIIYQVYHSLILGFDTPPCEHREDKGVYGSKKWSPSRSMIWYS